MPERDELQSELRRVADWLMEVEEQLARPKPPAEPVPPPRKAAARARAQGWLLGIPLLGGAVAFVRHHLGATVAVAATGVVLSLTPSLAPHVTEVPEPPSMALPSEERPPLEPRPKPPTPEPDSPEDTARDVETPEPEPDSTDPTDVTALPAQIPPAVEPAPDSPPDTRNGNGREDPPRREPRDEPPPEPRNEPPPPGPDCSIIELKTDVVRACVLPQ